MGIVQDGLLGVSLLTSKDTFLTKQDALSLVMWADKGQEIMDDIEEYGLPPPAIVFPEKLWTGKQIISMIMPSETNVRPHKLKENGFLQ